MVVPDLQDLSGLLVVLDSLGQLALWDLEDLTAVPDSLAVPDLQDLLDSQAAQDLLGQLAL
jgi:hypothetical protein